MSQITLREGVLAQTALEQAVLLDSVSGKYFELNPVGSTIIRCLLAGGDRDAALDAVVAEFAIDRERAAVDAAAFIDEMLRKGLLVSLPDA